MFSVIRICSGSVLTVCGEVFRGIGVFLFSLRFALLAQVLVRLSLKMKPACVPPPYRKASHSCCHGVVLRGKGTQNMVKSEHKTRIIQTSLEIVMTSGSVSGFLRLGCAGASASVPPPVPTSGSTLALAFLCQNFLLSRFQRRVGVGRLYHEVFPLAAAVYHRLQERVQVKREVHGLGEEEH